MDDFVLELFCNRDYAIPFVFSDDDDEPLNLDGCIVYFTVKRADDDADDDENAVYTLDIEEHSDPVNGETMLTFAKEDTKDIPPGTYVWDMTLELPDGELSTKAVGSIVFKKPKTMRVPD